MPKRRPLSLANVCTAHLLHCTFKHTAAAMSGQARLLEGQQAQINDLREEGSALCECLVAAGVLTREAILAQIHRLRFDKVHREHPLISEASFADAIEAEELAISVSRCAGSHAVRALRAVSKGVRKAASGALPAMDLLQLDNVFVCGGYDGERRLRLVDRFDPQSGVWQTVPSMGVRREAPVAAIVAGQLFVCGGFDGVRRLNVAERFDPSVAMWLPLPPMLSRRVGATATVLSSVLYVCGGFDGNQYLSAVESFDPVGSAGWEAQWEAKPPMANAREGAVGAALGSHLYICGGNDGTQTLRTVERFDADERNGSSHSGHTWMPLPGMSMRRDGAVGAVMRDRIYVCGGFDGEQSLSLRSTERFDPATGVWKLNSPMLARRAGAAAAIVAGQLYVCGGYDGAQNLIECERLDPAVGMWELLPPMRCRRGYAAGAAT